MKTIRVSNPYGEELAKFSALLTKLCVDPPAVDTVRSAIEKQGYWEEHDEWRICTVTTSRIRPVTEEGRAGYRVTVQCDYEFGCLCTTLERAGEFVAIYKSLIMHLFGTFGWPGWAAKDKVEP